MTETRMTTSPIRRVIIPLLVAIALVVGTVLVSGSSLIRIEDVVANRILAGTYGTPDWRVQEMNPLLAQVLTLLYRIAPMVNWYGVLLLALLFVSAAAALSMAGRRRGGLFPAIIVISPLIVLLTNSVISTAVCALASTVGALSLMDGLRRKKEGLPRAILGAVLFVLGAMLNLWIAGFLALCAAVCFLPFSIREERVRGLLIGIGIIIVLAAALFGYQSLMYASPELTAYRNSYALYESVQHSSLAGESDRLLAEHGLAVFTDPSENPAHGEEGHVHTEGDEDHAGEAEAIDLGAFDKVGWSLNDASMFFSRYSADAKLTDPEALSILNAEAQHWDFAPGRLFPALFETIKKPQFLLLIALFIVSALGVLITSRRRGFIVLLAAVIGFGGHVLSLARYYDSFADIAPFYLLAIVVMLYFFDGEDAHAWVRRVFQAATLRIALSALVAICFAGAMGGVLYYTARTSPNVNPYLVEAVDFLTPYIAEEHEPPMLFIGENPNERYKPGTLEAPQRGADATLLAGSYDLYSPRGAALMERFGIENPLPDSVNREDIAYVLIGFPEPVSIRLASAYDIFTKDATELLSYPAYGEKIIQLQSFTDAEVDAMMQQAEEQAALQAEADARFDEIMEEYLASQEAAEEASPAPTATATATAAPTATPTAAPRASGTAAPTATTQGNG